MSCLSKAELCDALISVRGLQNTNDGWCENLLEQLATVRTPWITQLLLYLFPEQHLENGCPDNRVGRMSGYNASFGECFCLLHNSNLNANSKLKSYWQKKKRSTSSAELGDIFILVFRESMIALFFHCFSPCHFSLVFCEIMSITCCCNTRHQALAQLDTVSLYLFILVHNNKHEKYSVHKF